MEKNASDLISLIRLVLIDEDIKLDNPNYESIFKIAKFHSLTNLLYYALMKYIEKNGSLNVDAKIIDALTKANKLELSKSATQECEMEILKEELEKRNIRYALLKGSIIKYMYPSFDMRSMADIDIYVDKEKAKDIKKMMIDLGYDVESYLKGNHDSYMKVPFMNVEMHRDLMNECYSYHLYYKDFFSKLHLKENKEYEYEFSHEDYYIYMIAHAAKHFSNGGMGIRNVIDEYIYLNEYENSLDFNYINEELAKLELNRFENNLKKLAKCWFGTEKINEEDLETIDLMGDFIIESGTYGTVSHNVLNQLMGETTYKNIRANKFKYLWSRAFPPYSVMVRRNPSLKKWKILLPWFYFTRLLKFIFKSNKNIDAELATTKQASDADIEKNKKVHEDVGA